MNESNTQLTRPGRRRRGGWFLGVLIILALFIGVQWLSSKPLASGPAPPLRTELTNAQTFDLRRWRGSPVLVHFWALWCPVCRLQEQGIERLSRDFQVVTVALQSGDDRDINAYLRRQRLSFPVIADPDGEISALWGVRGVPASFIIDGDGRIRFADLGYSTGFGLRTRLWAADLLKNDTHETTR